MIGRKDTKTNLTISKSNLEIAKATKRDGNRMRSIAVLTMIFLPATFVAVRLCSFSENYLGKHILI